MSAALAFPQPVVANPGGKSKAGAGGNGGGGPRGGGFGGVGGNNNLGNGGGGAKGSSDGQRRSRGGMPYADIRNNLGGTSYHGATGTPNNAVAVEAAGTKSKKGNNPQVPNVEEDGNYQVALNGAFQRGLSKADALDLK